jgi:hypothetical protein
MLKRVEHLLNLRLLLVLVFVGNQPVYLRQLMYHRLLEDFVALLQLPVLSLERSEFR